MTLPSPARLTGLFSDAEVNGREADAEVGVGSVVMRVSFSLPPQTRAETSHGHGGALPRDQPQSFSCRT